MINTAFVVESFFEGTRTDDARLRGAMAKGEILLAEDDTGAIAASVYVERRGERAYMGMLAVDPARQGAGVGRQVVEEAERRLRAEGVRAIDITVLSLRPELLPKYRKMGFRETGTEPFDGKQVLKPGYECHCITMTKDL